MVSPVVRGPPTFGLSRPLEENDLASMIGVVLREADELCVSRMARVFDRRVVQSILREAGNCAANLRVQFARGIDRRAEASKRLDGLLTFAETLGSTTA
jgi:hypothetical protein